MSLLDKKQKPDYFMHLDLPDYGKVGLIEGKGIHVLRSMFKAQNGKTFFLTYLILELLVINDDFVTEEFLNNMAMKDVNYIITVINTMMEEDYKI